VKEIDELLIGMSEEKFRDFTAGLIPETDRERILGVRVPLVKKLARELAADGRYHAFLDELPHRFHEENILHAEMICRLGRDIDTLLEYTEKFLPYIDNWAVCDTFIPKLFKQYPELIYKKTLEWLQSSHVYTVRFAIVTLLQNYLDEYFRKEINDYLAKLDSDEYYINMAIAWYFSFALIKQYDATIELFTGRRLKKWIHNKALQKAVESRRVNDGQKEWFRALKIV